MCESHRAIHRLATYHGHEWAQYVTEDECAADWAQAAAKAEAAAEAAPADSFYWHGVGPSTSHTTATGRLSWVLQPGGSIQIRVCRPGLIDGYTVASAVLTPYGDSWSWKITWDARAGDGVHLRHALTIYTAVQVATAPQYPLSWVEDGVISRIDAYSDETWGAGVWDDEFRGGTAQELYDRLVGERAAEAAARQEEDAAAKAEEDAAAQI